jgi:hypothetical protein
MQKNSTRQKCRPVEKDATATYLRNFDYVAQEQWSFGGDAASAFNASKPSVKVFFNKITTFKATFSA